MRRKKREIIKEGWKSKRRAGDFSKECRLFKRDFEDYREEFRGSKSRIRTNSK